MGDARQRCLNVRCAGLIIYSLNVPDARSIVRREFLAEIEGSNPNSYEFGYFAILTGKHRRLIERAAEGGGRSAIHGRLRLPVKRLLPTQSSIMFVQLVNGIVNHSLHGLAIACHEAAENFHSPGR